MKIKLKTLNELIIDILSLSFLTLFCLFLTACPIKDKKPIVDVKVYAGDSENAGIVRMQDNEIISCTDPKFDDYICISYNDLDKLILIINSCKKWK